MYSKTIPIIAVLLTLLTPLIAKGEGVLEQIDATNKAFAKGIMAGNIDYLVNDYTDDACIIAPKAPLTCGKESIRSFWTSVVASNPQNVEIITHNAEEEGNLSFATGELVITDASSAVHKSRFVLVFKRINDAWKLHIDSWTPQ